MTVPAIGALTVMSGSIVRSRSTRATSASLRPSDAQAMARGRQDTFCGSDVGFRRCLIGARLLELALRRGLGGVETGLTIGNVARKGQLGPALFERLHGRDQVGLGLNDLRTVDFEQRIAALHLVTDLGDQARHAAGERRQHGGAGVLVEGDLPDRGPLQVKRAQLDIDDGEPMHPLGGNSHHVCSLQRRLRGRFGRGEAAPAEKKRGEPRKARRGEAQSGIGDRIIQRPTQPSACLFFVTRVGPRSLHASRPRRSSISRRRRSRRSLCRREPHHGHQCQQEGYTNRSRDHVRELHGITSVGLCYSMMLPGVKQSFLTAS